ncbi:LamG domain-containing protein [Streptomyces sp. CMB-StM0423]|uniref:LamG domain-containing protein n=1 Tax=Streptomyces sp. CMB-StM0423 TaxID=2059884 RepID=UPI00131A6A0E|nr:LamG domain-containing protein [Streptomyces sp. CMB-StM0423]
MPEINRRSFIARSAAVGAAAFATPMFGEGLAAAAPGRPPGLDALTSAWLPRREVVHWPAVSNFWGAVGTGGNVLAIRNFTLAPYLDDGGDSCVLSIDGVPVPTGSARWSAHEITRKAATASGVEVYTATRLAFERNTLLQRITVSNPTATSLVVSVEANPRIARGAMPATWAWDPPRPGGDHTFTARQVSGANLLISDSGSSAVTAFAFAPAPTLAVGPTGGTARWSVAAGQSMTIDTVMEVGQTSTGAPLVDITDATETLAACNATIRRFQATFSAAAEEWRSRWYEAFTPDNGHYSGFLPVLRTDETDIARLYYMAILSVLVCERTNLSPAFSDVLGRPSEGFRGLDRVYVTGSPEWASTVSYFWDTSYCSVILAMLDPQMMKAKTAYWITKDIYAGYAIDWVSGNTVGPWYSANDLSVFTTTLNYVNHSGNLAFLDTTIPGTGKTVQEHLRSIATHWESLVPQGQSLADYGENHNLLEVLPKYTHQVASFNAGNVWMMEQAADLHRRTGDQAAANDLTDKADHLRREVLALYDPENNGVWNCRNNDGATVAVRTVLDFAIAGRLLAPSLSEEQKAAMKRFAATELLVGDWMRALSLSDSQAPVSRTDHGTTGAYDSWPALTAQTFARFGDYPKLLAQLKGFAGVTRRGPFSQSHQLLQIVGVSVADRPALNPAGAVTVSAWICPSQWPTEVWQGSILAKDSWGNRDGGYVLRGGAGGEISFVVALDGRFTEVRTTATIPTSGWHHVAGVYDGEGMQIFIDGVVRATRSATGTPTPSTGTHLVVGNCPSDLSRRFTGSVDEARVYARALSAAEIHAQYAATSPTTGADDSSLALRLPFDEGQGTTTTEAVTDQEFDVDGATWGSGRDGFGAALTFSEEAGSFHAVIASPSGLQCFNNLAGGAFADVIITDLFGYTPDGTTAELRDATTPRGINATLSGVVFNGRRHSITSGPEGLSLT